MDHSTQVLLNVKLSCIFSKITALDWLFDRINLDPKIQFKYVDTKNHLADMCTTGNFTCDEWNNFLRLFNKHNKFVCLFLQPEAARRKTRANDEFGVASPSLDAGVPNSPENFGT